MKDEKIVVEEVETEQVDVQRAVEEALAIHEALRRLGFSADDIHIEFADQGATSRDETGVETATIKGPVVGVTLQTQGKRFSALLGALAMESRAEFRAIWEHNVRAWNEGTIDRDRIWHASKVRNESVSFLMALFSSGIRPVSYDGGVN